jgi:hypothetical protein
MIHFYELPNGTYQAYLYAPYQANIFSGDIQANGIALPSFPGDEVTPINDVSYRTASVAVTKGVLATSGSDASSPDGESTQNPLPPSAQNRESPGVARPGPLCAVS